MVFLRIVQVLVGAVGNGYGGPTKGCTRGLLHNPARENNHNVSSCLERFVKRQRDFVLE